MYDRTITVFNLHGDTWYPHVIRNADLIAAEGKTHTAMAGETSADSVEIIVRFRWDCVRIVDGNKNAVGDLARNVLVCGAPFVAVDTDGGPMKYLPPKAFAACNDPADCITFTPETDFVYDGEWPDAAPVSDGEYGNGFYSDLNEERDGVYRITRAVQYRLLPHFEIGGR